MRFPLPVRCSDSLYHQLIPRRSFGEPQRVRRRRSSCSCTSLGTSTRALSGQRDAFLGGLTAVWFRDRVFFFPFMDERNRRRVNCAIGSSVGIKFRWAIQWYSSFILFFEQSKFVRLSWLFGGKTLYVHGSTFSPSHSISRLTFSVILTIQKDKTTSYLFFLPSIFHTSIFHRIQTPVTVKGL